MLHHDDGVAQITQVEQGLEQPLVVPLVQTDGGSSSTYMTPTRPAPIWLASRMRWASPPERVSAERDRLR